MDILRSINSLDILKTRINMEKELATILTEKAVYHLTLNPKALAELLEECEVQEIIGINEDTGIPYWYHTGDDLTD